VRLLLVKGADVKVKDEYAGTSLHAAARGGHKAIVQLLLKKGAEVEVKDEYRGTALHGADCNGHECVVHQRRGEGKIWRDGAVAGGSEQARGRGAVAHSFESTLGCLCHI
jgi:hypothetical protein